MASIPCSAEDSDDRPQVFENNGVARGMQEIGLLQAMQDLLGDTRSSRSPRQMAEKKGCESQQLQLPYYVVPRREGCRLEQRYGAAVVCAYCAHKGYGPFPLHLLSPWQLAPLPARRLEDLLEDPFAGIARP